MSVNMSLLIPYALSPTGGFLTPVSCPCDVVPTCPCCDEKLIKKCGNIIQWHFAHHSKSSGCSGGGGESLSHKAAKLIVAEYFHLFRFTQTCRSQRHSRARVGAPKYVARQEYRLPGTNMTVDVAILTEEGGLECIVEVFHTHATSDAAMERRKKFAPCFEVRADDVINAQKLIPLSEVSGAEIGLLCVNPCETEQCTWSCGLPPSEIEHSKCRCSECNEWGVGYVPIAPQSEEHFACGKCCVACDVCQAPRFRTFRPCGVCESKVRAEKMRQRSKRPCVGCSQWDVDLTPIAPRPTSRWRKEFVCKKCRGTCIECDDPCPKSIGWCGVCESKTWVEKMRQDREKRNVLFASCELEYRKRPCAGCAKWGVGYLPIRSNPSSRWRNDFVCEECCIPCYECDEPSLISLNLCGRCGFKVEMEAMREEEERQEKERVGDRMVKKYPPENELYEAHKVDMKQVREGCAKVGGPPERPPVPEWAKGRPSALEMMMDQRVQKVLYPDTPPPKKKKVRKLL